MALSNDSLRVGVAENQSQPSAAFNSDTLTVDLDDSYTNPGGGVVGGYDLSGIIQAGAKVMGDLPLVPHYDGSVLRWFKIIDDDGTPKLQAFVSTNGAPGVQVANEADLSGHTSLSVPYFYK